MGNDIFNLGSSAGVDSYGLGGAVNLRSGFDDLIFRHPNWMVYVRRDLRYPSVSYDPLSRSPMSDDSASFGTGYKVQFEKHPTRRVIPVASAQSPIEEFGYLAKFKTIVYTPRRYYPKSKDIYLEVEWDVGVSDIQMYGTPVRIIEAFQVDEMIAEREDEVTFVGCGCDTYNFQISDLESWLLQVGQNWVVPEAV